MVVVDLFHGDGTPDYLVTRDFFRDLKGCLAPGGIAVFNTFADLERPQVYAHLLTTLRAELPHIVALPAAMGGRDADEQLPRRRRGSRCPRPSACSSTTCPPRHEAALADMLERPLPLTRELLEAGRIVTDAGSTAAYVIARAQLAYRKAIVEAVPKAFLVN